MKTIFIILWLIPLLSNADFSPYWIITINHVSVNRNESPLFITYDYNEKKNDTIEIKYITCNKENHPRTIEVMNSHDSLIFKRTFILKDGNEGMKIALKNLMVDRDCCKEKYIDIYMIVGTERKRYKLTSFFFDSSRSMK